MQICVYIIQIGDYLLIGVLTCRCLLIKSEKIRLFYSNFELQMCVEMISKGKVVMIEKLPRRAIYFEFNVWKFETPLEICESNFWYLNFVAYACICPVKFILCFDIHAYRHSLFCIICVLVRLFSDFISMLIAIYYLLPGIRSARKKGINWIFICTSASITIVQKARKMYWLEKDNF